MTPDEKIVALNLTLPEPIKLPPDIVLPFSWVRVRGNRVYISGHIALNDDGSVYDVTGKVGADVSIEQGYEAARRTGLSILSSLKRELGHTESNYCLATGIRYDQYRTRVCANTCDHKWVLRLDS